MPLLGAVLAGGESRRFGSDKAHAPVGGRTLLDRAASVLSEVFPEVVVVSSRPASSRAWPRIPDLRPGRGPLAGVETALREASARKLDGAFVLACDLPLVRADSVRAVVEALGDRWVAAPVRDGPGGWEPLCAAYRVACLPWVSGALDRGELRVHGLLDALGAVGVALPPGTFLNVNTPADHARAVSVLEDGAG